MRAIRELPLAASLLLVSFATFFGGAGLDGSLWWLGGLALLALLVLTATLGVPGGFVSVVPLAALGAWLALSIGWSALPSRSWSYADRALVYMLFALVGLWLAGQTRALALGLAAVLGAVVAWSLLGKIVPPLYPDYGRIARLRGPVGLWNQLALLADFALPLALWRRGRSGTLLAFGWIVALLLTYSRGGVLTATVVVVAYFAFADERLERAATFLAAVVPAGIVVALAFALPGITSDPTSSSTRWRDGLIFGVLLAAGAAAALALERLPRPRDTPRLRRALIALGVLGAIAVIAVGALKAGSFGSTDSLGNSGGRFTSGSSNFRTVWWQQALDGWRPRKLTGTGAGSFHLTNLQYRETYLDETVEPHSLPLQMLSETGLVGLLLILLAAAFLLRHSLRRRGHELALALVLPAYLLHSLIDVDWDFAAVSAPAFLVAGALAGRVPLRRVSPFATLGTAGVAAVAFGALLLPWLGNRWADDALGAATARPADAVRLADRALSADPLLVEPYWAKADAAIELGERQRAFAYFVDAVDREPKNPQTWLQAGEYALSNRCYRLAYTYLERYTELDPKARPSAGGDDYRRARAFVNAGKNACQP
jgi:hypothetical protein